MVVVVAIVLTPQFPCTPHVVVEDTLLLVPTGVALKVAGVAMVAQAAAMGVERMEGEEATEGVVEDMVPGAAVMEVGDTEVGVAAMGEVAEEDTMTDIDPQNGCKAPPHRTVCIDTINAQYARIIISPTKHTFLAVNKLLH